MNVDLAEHQDLTRFAHDSGVVTYQCGRLNEMGIIHAFSTRLGGISKPPYASLNLDQPVKGEGSDNNTSIAENYRRLRRAIGAQRKMRIAVRQVHGAGVWQTPDKPQRWADTPEADAIITANPVHMLTIRTADCVPLLLAGPHGHTVAAVHAGWRGVVAQVVPAAVRELSERTAAAPAELIAAVGPCISADHYEVGEEVADAFREAGLQEAVDRSHGPKPHVDLRGAVVRQLQKAGVPDDRIAVSRCCTFAMEEEFFSYRRDGHTGRMATVIIPRAH
jgi:hypothetical protein